MPTIVKAQFPEKLKFLDRPMRYKVAYGGRGSAKSWSYARNLILRLTNRKLKWLCAREIQNSIDESVHALITLQIAQLGLSDIWDTTKKVISCQNGSEFIFSGLFRNVDKVRSIEGLDGVWIEEAHNISEKSIHLLTPTVRKDADPDLDEDDGYLTLELLEGSEIWVSFNPAYEDDYVYQHFVLNPPPDCISVEVNYMDNPWFPKVLQKEMEHDKATNYILYQNKWLGKPIGTGGKVFPNFDEKLHLKTFDRKLIAEKANCFMSMDPHSKYYPFCIWIAIIPKNDRMNWPEDFYKHIYAEWPTFEQLGGYYYELRKKLFYTGSLESVAKEIYARDGTEYGIKVLRRFIDSRYAKGAGGRNWSTSTLGVVELFSQPENGGLSFECPAEKLIDIQRERINSDMLYNKLQAVNIWNEPSLSVDPSCKNVIVSLRNHRLEEELNEEGSKEKESEKYKDPCDCLRIGYAGLNDFSYENPQSKPETYQPVLYPSGPDSWMM